MKTGKSIYLFVLPGFLLYSLFFLYPTLNGLLLSFTDWDGVATDWNWVGFENYTKMIFDDSIFQKSLGNNMKFMFVVVVFQTLFSLIFAIILVKNSKKNVFFRALFFFPTIISSVSVAFIWNFIYEPNFGMVTAILSKLGLMSLNLSWTGDPNIAIYSIAFVQVWFHTGQVLVIFVAGLQGISKDYYEAADIEGATRWQTFRHITWPLLSPATTIVVAYTTIQSFKAFDLIFAMTGGGPVYSTEILSTFIYHTAFEGFKFGYASAGSMIFMVIIGIITWVQFKALKGNNVSY